MAFSFGCLIGIPLVNTPLLPVSALTISNIQPGFTGTWECRVRTSRGNTTRTVHIVVLETSAKYCAPERVTNNRGEFRLVGRASALPGGQTCTLLLCVSYFF